jgi:dTDP-4-amino-4,6-dideoxygalactose transaminase
MDPSSLQTETVPAAAAPPRPVPFLDLKAQYAEIRGELHDAVLRVLDSQAFILGPEVEALEQDLAAYVGADHAVAVASGTDALVLSLRVLDVGPGDEVVTSAYSFFATAGAILQCGATPVFVDVDPGTYNLDPQALGAAMTPRTRALLPVHLYGQCAEMDPILAAAARAGVPVVEDAAQAIGARDGDRRAGALGTLGAFSFYPTKNLGGIGDGGLITTNDARLAARLRALRNHGQLRPYEHEFLGHNSRLDALNAAALRVKLRHLDRWTDLRRERAERYRRLMHATGLTSPAPDAIGLPVERPGAWHVYNQFVIRVPERDAVRDALQRQGIGCAVYYPRPLPDQPCLRSLGLPSGAYPNAAAAAREGLALPIYPELTPQQQERVVEALAALLRGRRGAPGLTAGPSTGTAAPRCRE